MQSASPDGEAENETLGHLLPHRFTAPELLLGWDKLYLFASLDLPSPQSLKEQFLQSMETKKLSFCVTYPPPRPPTSMLLLFCSFCLDTLFSESPARSVVSEKQKRLRCLLLSVRKVQCYLAFLSLGIVCYGLVNISQW